jgi:hypothetical protein
LIKNDFWLIRHLGTKITQHVASILSAAHRSKKSKQQFLLTTLNIEVIISQTNKSVLSFSSQNSPENIFCHDKNNNSSQ